MQNTRGLSTTHYGNDSNVTSSYGSTLKGNWVKLFKVPGKTLQSPRSMSFWMKMRHCIWQMYLCYSHLCLLLLLLQLLLEQLDLVVDRQGGPGWQRARGREQHPGAGHQQRSLLWSLHEREKVTAVASNSQRWYEKISKNLTFAIRH